MKILSTIILFLAITLGVRAGGGCEANFSYNVQGLEVQFVDSSKNLFDTTFYSWTFWGDGTKSNLQNPIHTFITPGDHIVQLSIKTVVPGLTDTCYSFVSDTINLQDPANECLSQSSFIAIEDTNVKRKFQFYFTGESNTTQDYQTEYNWNFGDGSTSTDQHPIHTYSFNQDFIVCLEIKNYKVGSGFDTCFQTYCDTVVVETEAENTNECKAYFQYSTVEKKAFFTNSSITAANSTVSYIWDFGDRSPISTAKNPTYTYPAGGKYIVCLEVTAIKDADTCKSTYCDTVEISVPACKANFEYSQNGNKITYVNKSFPKNGSTNWKWNFGDGRTSTALNPVVEYPNPGHYIVCLTIFTPDDSQMDSCADTFCETVIVNGIPKDSLVCVFGYVYNDKDGNGTKDGADNGLEGKNVQINPGKHLVKTNTDGFYKMYLPFKTVYEVEVLHREHWLQTEPTLRKDYSVEFTAKGQCKGNFNFGLFAQTKTTEVGINIISIGKTRPGFLKEYVIHYRNRGNQEVSGEIKFVYDNELKFLFTNPTQTTNNPKTRLVKWNYNNLLPGEFRSIKVVCRVDSFATLGDTIRTVATISPEEDFVPLNNYAINYDVISGSYDPNDKIVLPLGTGDQNYIGLSPEFLTYTIRFQNTGTDTAFNIRIEDPISSNLELSTLDVIASSHPYDVVIGENNEVKFYFNDILLADSNINEVLSHGFITYIIEPKAGLVQGDKIENTAYIYFDFNEPIITNTTLSTVGNDPTSSISNSDLNSIDVKVYPMPIYNEAVIEFDNPLDESFTLEVLDLNGRVLINQSVNQVNHIVLNRNGLKNGLYVYKLYSETQQANGRIILQ
ncbi:MAG: PKD repeat protein [Sphingobacteriales bacterium]|jgi:PKD repeat protein